MKSLFTLVTFLFLSLSMGIAQSDYISQNGNIYTYSGQNYKYKDLKPILEQSPEVMNDYNEVMRRKKRAETYAVFAMLTGVTGVGLYGNAWNDDRLDTAAPKAAIGIILSGGSLILTFAAIHNNGKAKKNMRSSIDQFNILQGQKPTEREVKLDLGMVGNGVGLTYSF